MIALKDRNKQIPGGMKFYDSAIKWTAAPWSSFQTIVNGLIAARLANPGITQQNNLATDPDTVAAEVDYYEARICFDLGAYDYITGLSGGQADIAPFPQPKRSLGQRLNAVVAGSEALVEWIADGADAVPSEQANSRAAICSKCPHNQKGDWLSYFTKPVSEAIRSAMKKRGEMALSTPHDDKLGVCDRCYCVMALKCHVPLNNFYSHMDSDVLKILPSGCWIPKEAKEAGY